MFNNELKGLENFALSLMQLFQSVHRARMLAFLRPCSLQICTFNGLICVMQWEWMDSTVKMMALKSSKIWLIQLCAIMLNPSKITSPFKNTGTHTRGGLTGQLIMWAIDDKISLTSCWRTLVDQRSWTHTLIEHFQRTAGKWLEKLLECDIKLKWQKCEKLSSNNSPSYPEVFDPVSLYEPLNKVSSWGNESM